MKPNDILQSVSLRRLRVFLAVCDTMHMARAAERLEIAQPSLSQQIGALESAVGVKLFHRRKRGIDLTDAGVRLQTEATKLLDTHTHIIDDIRRIGRGEKGRVAVGYVGSAMSEPEFPAQLKAMQEEHPDIELSLREGSIVPLLNSLEDGELDVALIRAPIPVHSPLKYRLHSTQDLVAILPTNHPLTRQEHVSIADLATFPMVGFPDIDNNLGIMQIVQNLAARSGCSIQIGWKASEVSGILGLVSAGLGYGVVPRLVAMRADLALEVRPISDPDATADLWLVWHGNRQSSALKQFIAMVTPS